MKQAKNVTQYLPQGIFDKELNDWLKTAFLSGEVTSSRAVLRGAIKDFPFDKNDGEFTIESKVNNIDFRFAPDWPVLEKVSGTLIFSGRKMTADVNSATTLGIPLANIHEFLKCSISSFAQSFFFLTNKLLKFLYFLTPGFFKIT